MRIYYTHKYSGKREDSHRLLERAIGIHTGDPELAGKLIRRITTTGEHGKPCIQGFDNFSISHSGNTWAVLICQKTCGLDVEYGRKADIAAISRRFFAPEDASCVLSEMETGDSNGLSAFLRIWTRREALVKAAGTSAADSLAPAVCTGYAEYSGRRWLTENIDIPGESGLYAAVCVESGEGEPGGTDILPSEIEITVL